MNGQEPPLTGQTCPYDGLPVVRGKGESTRLKTFQVFSETPGRGARRNDEINVSWDQLAVPLQARPAP